jgi:hypothetical protein
MSEPTSSRPRRAGKRNDPRALGRFLEELSWLLSSYEDLDFKALPQIVEDQSRSSRRFDNASDEDEHVQLLGTLPALFMDEELFATNEDIAEFSSHALGVSIPRWQKKSKYEIIGHVVCHAKLLNGENLRRLVGAVTKIQDRRSGERASLKKQRTMGLSWNEVIQRMLAGSSNESF